MSSSTLDDGNTVKGTAVERFLANGDREVEYSWDLPPLQSVNDVITLPKPVFLRGAFASPAWRQKFNARYSVRELRLEIPYPEPSHGPWRLWRVESASVEVEEGRPLTLVGVVVTNGEGGGRRRVLGDGHGRGYHYGCSRWREGRTMIVIATPDGRPFRPTAWPPKTVKIKIVSRYMEQEDDDEGEPLPDEKTTRVELNPIILAAFNSPELSDVQLVCQGETFFCHKLILSVGSPVFKQMFLLDTKENQESLVQIKDVTKDVLGLMLAWMYGEDIFPKLEKEAPQIRMELFKLADRYLLEGLKKSLLGPIIRSTSAETAFDIYALGDSCNEERFKTKGAKVMKRERSSVFSNDDVFDECVRKYPKLMQDILKAT